MICPHCENSAKDHEEFCSSCGGILPVTEQTDHYRVLGYERPLLNLDLVELEKRFLDLSRKFHPDRYANKSPLANQIAHDRSSAVNNAYRTLKSVVERAKYTVERQLGSIEETSSTVPPDMADLFFEVHESIDEIRDSGDQPPTHAIAVVERTKNELDEKVKKLEQDLLQKFIEYDTAPREESVKQIKEILSQRSYIKSFLRQIESVLHNEDAE